MIPKAVIEKAAEDWFDLVARKHIPIIPGTFTELWIPNEAVPDLAFQAGARWALEEIKKCEEMSEATEKAQEREKVLREGFELFEKMEARVFDELSDILPNWKDLKITDYFRLGFTQGYLEGYRKTKGETRPETKECQPMPEILPGYLVTYNNEEWAVTKQDYRGCLEIYRDRQRISGVDPKDVTRIWNENGILLWSKE